MSYFWPFFFFLKESVARFFKGKTRGDVGADRRDPVQHPSPSRAMQRQPAGQLGGARLQAGRESGRAASVQRSGAGWQHDAVSRRQSPHVFATPPPLRPERVFSAFFLSSYFAVNDAERTACPKQARSKQRKANTGRTTPRGRGKGSVFLPSLLFCRISQLRPPVFRLSQTFQVN